MSPLPASGEEGVGSVGGEEGGGSVGGGDQGGGRVGGDEGSGDGGGGGGDGLPTSMKIMYELDVSVALCQAVSYGHVALRAATETLSDAELEPQWEEGRGPTPSSI